MKNAWDNIEVSPDDEEILAIDRFEQSIDRIPERVYQVRELITRFETCHFKYRKHYKHILESIAALRPVVEVDAIGLYHPSHEGEGWKKDTTGRSRLGHWYIIALQNWIDEVPVSELEEMRQEGLDLKQQVDAALGDKTDEKIRLVHLLIARILGQPMDAYWLGDDLSELENQIIRTDICSYAFPANLRLVIEGIGHLKPAEGFAGCGSHNAERIDYIGNELLRLCNWLKSEHPKEDLGLGTKDPLKVWLVACLAKTMKEAVHLDRIRLNIKGTVSVQCHNE